MSVAPASPLILLVGSNASELSEARRVLSSAGLRVEAASTIDAADAFLDTASVDLVLIDLHLSEISGHDFADYLLDAKQITAPIVLWSNLKPDRLAGLIAECGAAGAVLKDLTMSSLLEDLRTFLCLPAGPLK